MRMEIKLTSSLKIRMSRQRKAILKALMGVTSHPTADEVYEMVRRKLPHISLGTVYRNLEILSAGGMIQKLQLGSTQMRFDGNTTNHYHVRCVGCGRVDDVPMNTLDSCEDVLRDKCGYQITGHRLEFIGICPRCQDEREGDEAA